MLASIIRNVWAPLFESSHNPHKEDDTTLRRYFNIHSGGSESTIAYQIQTFKAACDHADFSASSTRTGTSVKPTGAAPTGTGGSGGSGGGGEVPAIHIDLHIHLPENKSRRDYEYIFEDIARYIFGREPSRTRDEQN